MPYGLKVYKGYKSNVVSFDKSAFLVRHEVSIEYSNWIQDMPVADESFFPTLLRISKVEKVNGKWEVTQDLEMKGDKHLCPRTSIWFGPCKGKVIDEICNVAVPDPKQLRSPGCFLGNKFSCDVDATEPFYMGSNLVIWGDQGTALFQRMTCGYCTLTSKDHIGKGFNATETGQKLESPCQVSDQ